MTLSSDQINAARVMARQLRAFAEFAKVVEEIGDLDANRVEAESRMQSANEQANAAREKLDTYNRQISEAQTKLDAHQRRVSEQEAKLHQKLEKDAIEGLKAIATKAEEAEASIAKQRASWDNELKTIIGVRDDLDAEIAELKATRNALKDEIAAIRDKFKEV